MYKSGRGETSKRRGLLAIREGVDDPRPLFTRVLPLFHYWPVEERQVGKGVTVTNCRKGDHDMPPLVNLIGFAPRLPMQSLLHDLSSLLPSPRPIFRFLSRNGARFLRTTGPPMVIWTGAALRKRIPIPRFLSSLLEELGRRTKETNEWRWSRFFDRDAVTMIRRNNGVENYQSSSPFPFSPCNDFSGCAPPFLTPYTYTRSLHWNAEVRFLRASCNFQLLARYSCLRKHADRCRLLFIPLVLFPLALLFSSLSCTDPCTRPLFRRVGIGIGNVSSVTRPLAYKYIRQSTSADSRRRKLEQFSFLSFSFPFLFSFFFFLYK